MQSNHKIYYFVLIVHLTPILGIFIENNFYKYLYVLITYFIGSIFFLKYYIKNY